MIKFIIFRICLIAYWHFAYFIVISRVFGYFGIARSGLGYFGIRNALISETDKVGSQGIRKLKRARHKVGPQGQPDALAHRYVIGRQSVTDRRH